MMARSVRHLRIRAERREIGALTDMLNCRNQIERNSETWRPLFKPVRTLADRLDAAARRDLDLKAGSIWSDPRQLLPRNRSFSVDVGWGPSSIDH